MASEICRHQSNPEKLLENADLEQQWKNLSIAITKNAFPDLSTQINKWVLDNVLPTKIEYYFKNYRKTFEITLEHPLLKVVHDIEARMTCRPNRSDVTFEMGISLAAPHRVG